MKAIGYDNAVVSSWPNLLSDKGMLPSVVQSSGGACTQERACLAFGLITAQRFVAFMACRFMADVCAYF
jgi:hypothetical protein